MNHFANSINHLVLIYLIRFILLIEIGGKISWAQPVDVEKLINIFDSNFDLNPNDDDEDDDEMENVAGDTVQISYIEQSFTNRRSFTCARTKALFVSGTSAANLSPEDVDVLAVMGDAISTGIGLYLDDTSIEFRGAAFTSGGDANTNGLNTFANVLSVFNPKLEGVSHGMGSVETLPIYQLNLARNGAESDNMLTQTNELVTRINLLYTANELREKWIFVLITIGTEEFCLRCEEPNTDVLRRAVNYLRRALPRALVVLVGPVHVAHSSRLNYNLLNRRSNHELRDLKNLWRARLLALEGEFTAQNYTTFVLLVIPTLQIESRKPEQLFIADKPLLNKLGHAYAAKWLWNRLLSGWKYNASTIPLSEDSFYCPSMNCPFFRTPANRKRCVPMTHREAMLLAALAQRATNEGDVAMIHGVRALISAHWALSTILLFGASALSVCIFGAIFYAHGLRATKGRYEESQGV